MQCLRSKFRSLIRTLNIPREGVIIECPLNDLFRDIVTVILTPQMGVSEMVVNVGNVVTVIYRIIHSHFSEKSRLLKRMTKIINCKYFFGHVLLLMFVIS